MGRPTHVLPPARRAPARRAGFALLVTIVLVAFLVLILVGLATFARVETQVAANTAELAKARQNALFALNLAMGKLQQAAGPDQRVTATAETVAGAHATKRKWTGAWDTTNPGAGPTWLVSGAAPAVAAAAPALAGVDVNATAVRLVGDATADVAAAGAEIVVPLEELRAAGVPGLADPGGGNLVGRYAFWVGDEGVKARANLGDELGAKASPDFADTLNRAALAQRSALEWQRTGVGAATLGDLIPAAALPDLDRVLAAEQFAFTAADAASATALAAARRTRFHDLSFHSAGVQADTRLGGLKRDLTAAFEMTDADFQASTFANGAAATERAPMALSPSDSVGFVFSEPVGGGLRYRGPTWHLLRSHYRLYRAITNPTGVPEIAARGARPAVGTGGTSTYLDLFNGVGLNADPKTNDTVAKYGSSQTTPRATESTLLPYVNRVTLVASLQTVSSGVASPDGVPIYTVRVVLTPYVVLHNPYAVRLQLRDHSGDNRWGRLLFRGIHFDQLVRTTRDGGASYEITTRTGTQDRQQAIPLLLAGMASGTGGYNSFMNLYIPPITMEPGEVRVFSGNLSGTVPVGSDIDLADNAYFESGYYFDRLNAARAELFGQPYTRAGLPIGVDGALVVPADDMARVLADRPLWLGMFAATKSGENNNAIFRFYAESRPGENVGQESTLQAEFHMQAPATSGADAAYSGYSSFEGFQGGDLASSYAGVPTPMFAWDYFVKPADHDSGKAARPFVTSNPLAVVTQRDSMGDWSSRGFPLTQAPWQVTYRRLSPNAWSENSVLDVDPDGNGRAYWGPSNTDSGLQQVAVLGVPARPMSSLAEFQHLAFSLYGHEPARAIGNSTATPFNSPTSFLVNVRKGGGGGIDWWQADVSYLANRALWDSVFFSTLAPGFDAAAGSFYIGDVASAPLSRETVRDAWLAGARSLPNTRMRPYFSERRGAATTRAELLDPLKAAGNLLVEGSFNVNSRSVEAWTAVLAGARSAAVARLGGASSAVGDDLGVPRFLPAAGAARDATNANIWNGFVRLTDDDVRDLAGRIVAEVTARQQADGRPFLSLGEFVNRRVSAPADAALNAQGAIQSAIDAAGLNGVIPGTAVSATTQTGFPYPQQGAGSAAAAASAWLSQADVLQQIGPFLAARSDTFVVRAYGESVNAARDDETTARAWCEAVVQRTPDYVDPADEPSVAPADLSSTFNAAFGRKFRVVAFRWLTSDDL